MKKKKSRAPRMVVDMSEGYTCEGHCFISRNAKKCFNCDKQKEEHYVTCNECGAIGNWLDFIRRGLCHDQRKQN